MECLDWNAKGIFLLKIKIFTFCAFVSVVLHKVNHLNF